MRIKLGRLAFAILLPLLAIALFLITGTAAVVQRAVPNQAFAATSSDGPASVPAETVEVTGTPSVADAHVRVGVDELVAAASLSAKSAAVHVHHPFLRRSG
jgi:hypothetical protein